MNRLKKSWHKTQQVFFLGLAGCLSPSVSQAQTIESILNSTATYLQGGLARSIGVLGIVVSGYLCLVQQKFPKEYFIMILVGMGLIFGGSTLYTTLIA
ncbi:MAG: TrbC/VirB2 family protein [Legionella sp.]|nr:TrbC/VirB2 family protein [Legionella sp.]